MMKTLFQTGGPFQELTVTRQGKVLTLWSAAGIRHTVFDSGSPHVPGLEYARNLLAALAFCPRAPSCLVLGLGGGSVPRMLAAARPEMEVDAVEIDPAVVDVAGAYFDVRALPRLRIHLEDAAVFLRASTSRYAIVVVDTYLGGRFPEQCAGAGFFRDIRRCLPDDGVLAVNWMRGDGRAEQALLDNLRAVSGQVWRLPGLRSRNVLYFAPARKTTRAAILSAAQAAGADIPFENALARLAHRLRESA